MAFHQIGKMPSLFGTHSAISVGDGLNAVLMGAYDSEVLTGAANTTIYVPVVFTETVTIVKGWWINGGGISGNVDIGLYPETGGTKIVSLGSTAQSGSSTIQEGNIADTSVPAGRYLMALAWSSATATFGGWLPTTAIGKAMGLAMESAFALPASATPVVFSGGTIDVLPLFGFSLRTLVA